MNLLYLKNSTMGSLFYSFSIFSCNDPANAVLAELARHCSVWLVVFPIFAFLNTKSLPHQSFFYQEIRQHVRCRCCDFDAVFAVFRRAEA